MQKSVGLAVMLAMGVGLPARAQVTPDAMAQGRQPRRVDVQLQGQVEHDTNLIRTTRALAAAQGLSLADTVYAPTLNIDLLLPLGRQAVFARGSAGYMFHERNRRLDTERFDLEGGLGGSVGPCGTVVGGGYQRGRSELNDQTLVTSIENILEVKSVNAGLTCIKSPGLGVTLTASKSWASNSSVRATNGDYHTDTISGGLIYGRPIAGSVSLQGQYAQTKYTDQPAVPRATDGYTSLGGGLRVERKLGTRLQASAGLSYTAVNVDRSATPVLGAPPIKDFKGLTYSADAAYRISSRFRVQGKFERAVQPTLLTGGGFELQTNYSGRVEYRLGSRITVSLGAEQQKSDVRGNAATVGLVLTDARTRAASSTISYRQSDRLTFTLSGRLEERKANDPRFEYSSERIGASANVNF